MLSIRPTSVRFGEFRIEKPKDNCSRYVKENWSKDGWSKDIKAEMEKDQAYRDVIQGFEAQGYDVSISLEKPTNWFLSEKGTYNINLISRASNKTVDSVQLTKDGGIYVFIASMFREVREMIKQATGKRQG